MENIQPSAPISQKKSKAGLIIVGVAVFLILLAALVFFYITTQKPERNEDPSPETTEISPTIEPAETSGYFDYIWYEDDYVKFMYPDGWDVDVYYSNDLSRAFGEKVAGFVGPLRITLRGGPTESLSLESIVLNNKGKTGTILYDPTDDTVQVKWPNKEKSNFHNYGNVDIQEIDFYNKYIIHFDEFDEAIGDSLAILYGTLIANYENGIYEMDYHNYGGGASAGNYTVVQFPVINAGGNTDSLLSLYCDVRDEVEADKCAEFINKFFDTAERVNLTATDTKIDELAPYKISQII